MLFTLIGLQFISVFVKHTGSPIQAVIQASSQPTTPAVAVFQDPDHLFWAIPPSSPLFPFPFLLSLLLSLLPFPSPSGSDHQPSPARSRQRAVSFTSGVPGRRSIFSVFWADEMSLMATISVLCGNQNIRPRLNQNFRLHYVTGPTDQGSRSFVQKNFQDFFQYPKTFFQDSLRHQRHVNIETNRSY